MMEPAQSESNAIPPSSESTPGPPPSPWKRMVREYAEALIIALLAALFIRSFVVQAFRIPTGSMEDTLLVGDFLLVNKCVYGAKVPYTSWRLPGWDEPQPGDVVVFKYPKNPELDYIKRCIAVAGQTVEIRNKQVYVDGTPVPLPPEAKFIDTYIKSAQLKEADIVPEGAGNRDNYGPVVVPEGHLFTMGDNRDNSLDSRYWGFLPKENIVGKALIIYFSWDLHMPLQMFMEKVRWGRLVQIIH